MIRLQVIYFFQIQSKNFNHKFIVVSEVGALEFLKTSMFEHFLNVFKIFIRGKKLFFLKEKTFVFFRKKSLKRFLKFKISRTKKLPQMSQKNTHTITLAFSTFHLSFCKTGVQLGISQIQCARLCACAFVKLFIWVGVGVKKRTNFYCCIKFLH